MSISTDSVTEGMFNPETLDKFIILQSFNNPNTYFDLKKLSQQATEQDMQYYNANGHWYWDDVTKKAYEDDLQHNQMLQEYPKGTYMRTAQNTYNQNIMKKILSWRAPEGEFLMNGVITGNADYENTLNDNSGRGKFPYESGLLPKGDAVVVCNNNKISLKKMVGSSVPIYAPLDYNLLPKLVPGFKFLKGSCDPCGALKDTPEYGCPFVLGDKEPSYIWKYLWGI
jgi:Fe-S cluster biosynthesis and repair protein YggX